MKSKKILTFICLSLCLAASIHSQRLAKWSKPEDAGFSSQHLSRITTLFQSNIEKGAIPGVVIIVARNGKIVYSQALGFQDREQHLPMKPDAISRIASMSKPITSVALCSRKKAESTCSRRSPNIYRSSMKSR